MQIATPQAQQDANREESGSLDKMLPPSANPEDSPDVEAQNSPQYLPLRLPILPEGSSRPKTTHLAPGINKMQDIPSQTDRVGFGMSMLR